MAVISTSSLTHIEGVVMVTLVASYVLWFTIRTLARTRPDLHIALPIAIGFGLRLAAIASVGSLGLDATLRGGDETTFVGRAQFLASSPLSHAYLPHAGYQLQTILFALQLKLGFITAGALRITQVAIALLGVVLITAAVHDLANGRAARLTAWLLAIEPTAIFYNSALHKEPNMELAAGLVVFGGTMIWRRLDVRGLLLCALGGLIAVETRAYAGWFLVSAAILILLHAALRNLERPMRAMPAIYAVAIIAFLATPVLLQVSSKKNLQALQTSQTANSTGQGVSTTGPNSDNLALEQVNYSTRGSILSNLPTRMRDVVLKPYPWQLGDMSQRVGAIGTLVAYVILFFLLRYAWLSRGQVFPRAAPLLYPAMFMLVAYSLSAGNAGTGFRYRSHLVTLGLAALVLLREHVVLARASNQVPSEVAAPEATAMAVASPV